MELRRIDLVFLHPDLRDPNIGKPTRYHLVVALEMKMATIDSDEVFWRSLHRNLYDRDSNGSSSGPKALT